MFAQTMLAAVPDYLFTWALRQETWLQRKLQELALRKARARAYQRFAQQNPEWADSLFDEYFLANRAAPLLARYAQPANRTTPMELALAWFEECRGSQAAARKYNLTEVVAVAAEFLRDLDLELRAYPAARAGAIAAPRGAQPASGCAAVAGAAEVSALFAEALRENSNLEMDWLWLATVVTSLDERGYCLQRALEINPDSEIAEYELRRLPR
jgi:hypothetical protein